MAPSTASASRRGRRLLAIAFLAAALLTGTTTLFGGASVGHAASPAPGVDAAPICKPVCPSPTPTDTPTPAPTPNSCQYYPDLCPSPSPTLVVVSPVTPDPSPVPATPAYLIGTAPSPTQSADGSTVISSPVPVGGGFVDQLPTPSQPSAVGATGDLAPHQGGLPLPFLAVGALLILGAVGSLIYAVAPREKPIFNRTPPGPAAPVMFTPYGPDTRATNILSGGQAPRPGPKKPA